MSSKLKKISGLAAGVAVALLVACGGGGGSTPPPVTTPAPVITAALTADKCDVQSGNGLCTVTESHSVTNATAVTLTDAGGKVLSSKTSDTLVVNVLVGSNSYTVTATGPGGTVSKTLSATGTCATGSAPSGTTCVAQVQAVLTATSPVQAGGKSTLTWSWTGGKPDSCVTSSNWGNSGNLTGTGLSDALTVDTTFTYACTNGNGTTTATAIVKVSCPVAGQMIVNGVCADPLLHYADKVYAVWTGGQIYSVTKTGVALLTNMTQYTAGGWPVWGCWEAKPSVSILSGGKIITSCQEAINKTRHYFYIDPTTDSLYEYVGQVPATLQCVENADKSWTCPANTDWVAAQGNPPANAPAVATGTATETSDSWYFVTGEARWVLKRMNKTGPAAGVVEIVKDGNYNADGTVDVLFAYDHP